MNNLKAFLRVCIMILKELKVKKRKKELNYLLDISLMEPTVTVDIKIKKKLMDQIHEHIPLIRNVYNELSNVDTASIYNQTLYSKFLNNYYPLNECMDKIERYTDVSINK